MHVFQEITIKSKLPIPTKFSDIGIILFRRGCFIQWSQKMQYFGISKHWKSAGPVPGIDMATIVVIKSYNHKHIAFQTCCSWLIV